MTGRRELSPPSPDLLVLATRAARNYVRPRLDGGQQAVLCYPAMNDVLAALIAERDRLDKAIAILQGEHLPKRRGRPPGSKSKTAAKSGSKMSSAARKAHSARMKKYWAQRRKEKPAVT